jgi:hypothetical protein
MSEESIIERENQIIDSLLRQQQRAAKLAKMTVEERIELSKKQHRRTKNRKCTKTRSTTKG